MNATVLVGLQVPNHLQVKYISYLWLQAHKCTSHQTTYFLVSWHPNLLLSQGVPKNLPIPAGRQQSKLALLSLY